MRVSKSINKMVRIVLRSVAGIRLVILFSLILVVSSVAVFLMEHTENGGFGSLQDSLWWTIVTVSTVGYGDRYPLTMGGRLFAVLIMFLGVGVMGTVTGRIASFLMERQMKEDKGLLSYGKSRGHFIICGWKREMSMLLLEMLANNKNLDPQQIIMINKASSEEINALRSDPNLKDIRFVYGDFIEERDLQRAGIKEAVRVLVVADHYTEGNIQQIDSQTVMAVMTIKNINRKAYVCAEILDHKYEKYLKLSHCDEVLLSRDFSRSMLVSAAQGAGTSHVVYALLAQQSGAKITTIELPDRFIGATVEEVRAFCAQEGDMLLVGLLENTGNLIERKSEALRETQKSPNIEKIITNLQAIKELEANVPVINPPGNYQVRKYSRAVVICGNTTAETVAV